MFYILDILLLDVTIFLVSAYMPHHRTYLHSSAFRSPLAASDPGGLERCEYRDFEMEVERMDIASAFAF